jgi:hypothetical protein
MICSATPRKVNHVFPVPLPVLFFISSAETLAWQAFHPSLILIINYFTKEIYFLQVETIRVAGHLNNDLQE